MTRWVGRRTILFFLATLAALLTMVGSQTDRAGAQPAGTLFDHRPRLELPLSAGSSLIGWQGVEVESTSLLDAHPGIDRVWTFDAAAGWIVDAPGLPAAIRRSFPITAGTGLFIIASEPVTLRVPLPPGPVRLSAAADGARLVVDPDVAIDLLLRGNPTTGFDWDAVDTTNLLQFEGRDFTPDSELIGAGGISRFSYRTEGTGETTLDLAYQRTFEPQPLATLSIAITVIGLMPPPEEGAGQFVFSSDRGGDYANLYRLDLATGEATRLTSEETTQFAGPYAPTGDRIAYTSFGLIGSDVFTMQPDGSDPRNLTNDDPASNSFPRWSPDGTRIVFTAWHDGHNDLYEMQADGAGVTALTSAPSDDWGADWAPDGTTLVFLSDRDNAAGVYDLYLLDLTSQAATRLTNDGVNHYAPAWSPDGQWIAFRGHENGGAADIFVIRPDGTDLRNLTNDPAEDWSPRWSPDGTQIAFQTDRDGNWEIYTMAADGSDPTNRTQDPADEQWPFWQPATRLVHFVPAQPDPATTVSGSCFSGSLAAPGRPDAWRCATGNDLHDPCFALDAETVVCGANPATNETGFLLDLREPLPESEVTPEAMAAASVNGWLVRLADGTLCNFATGATGGVDGKRANYACADDRWILGDLIPGAPWLADIATISVTVDGWQVDTRAEVPIAVVWQ